MGRQGTLAYWLLQMLVFVTGNLGVRGGNVYSLGFYSRSPAAGSAVPEGFLDTALDLHLALRLSNRTILFFDRAVMYAAQGYES